MREFKRLESVRVDPWKESDIPWIWPGTSMFWRNDAKELHRDGDKPAVILFAGTEDGVLKWCKDGLMHRDGDLPALIGANGYKAWYRDGEFIREERG